MSRSSARRGQVEPLAAIAAVFAIGVGLALYATILGATYPGEADRDVAEPTLAKVSEAVVDNGVVSPEALERLGTAAAGGHHEYAPDGYRMRVVLTAGDREWATTPGSPESARSASRRVGVKLAPGNVRPGRLRVEVWR